MRSSSGFSLVGVLVAVGILSIIAMGIASQMNDMVRAQNFQKTRAEAENYIDELRAQLSSPESCLQTFAGSTLTNGATLDLTQLKGADGSVVATVNVTRVSNSLTISRMTFNYGVATDPLGPGDLPAPNPTNSGEGVLNVYLRSQIDVLGPRDFSPRKIIIRTTKTGANVIAECLAKAKMTDGIWRKTMNLNDIFYTGGSVGVGTIAPVVALHVRGAGVPLHVESSNTNQNKIGFFDGGTAQGYIGAGAGKAFAVQDAGGVERITVLGSASGYVGVNNTLPSTSLHVVGGGAPLRVDSNDGNHNKIILGTQFTPISYLGASLSRPFTVQNSGGSDLLSILSSGNVGIGSLFPATKLQVEGVIAPGTDSMWTLGTSILRFTNIYATNSVVQTSDEREKKDILPLAAGLDFINRLRPVSYRWAAGGDSDQHAGFSAQQVERVLREMPGVPHAILSLDTEHDRYGLRYTEIIAPLVKAVQELHQENQRLKARLLALEREKARL